MTVASDLVTAVAANTSHAIDTRVQQVVTGIVTRLAAITAAPGADQAATVALINTFHADLTTNKAALAAAVRTTQSGVRPRYF